MIRESLRYGHKVTLFCDARSGYVLGTNSALAPLGVKDDAEDDPVAFERAVFTVFPADGDINDPGRQRHLGEEVKFGQVIRLVHNTQRKTITHNNKLHALVDKANQRVTLEKKLQSGDQTKWDKWRIMPRYKVRGEGERVCNADHVVLQVSTGEQSYLHVSKKEDEAVDGCYEVNAGAVSEGFAIRIYDSELPKLVGREERELRGGDCIMLYHKEERSYVRMDQGLKRCLLEPVPETTLATHKTPDTQDSHTMFIIEFSDRSQGGIVTSGRKQLFRLKALSTGEYLCVKPLEIHMDRHHDSLQASMNSNVQSSKPSKTRERGKSIVNFAAAMDEEVDDEIEYYVGMTRDISDFGTLFAFHQAADDQGAQLKSRSRVFAECPLIGGGLWIIGGSRVIRRSMSEVLNLPHGGGRGGTTRPQKLIRCQHENSPKDGLEIQRLRSSDYQHLSTILSLLPPLHAFNKSLVSEMPDHSRVAQVQENLVHLRRLCFDDTNEEAFSSEAVEGLMDGVVDPLGQKRLLDQDVAQLCIEIVRNVFNSPYIDTSLLHSTELIGAGLTTSFELNASDATQVKYVDVLDVVNLCFLVVQLIVKDAPLNSLELAPQIEFIVTCVDKLPSALSCLKECFKDNFALVDTPNDLKVLEHFCDLLQQRGHDRGVLELLTLIVECNGVGLPAAQHLASERLIKKQPDRPPVFVPFTANGGQIAVGVPAYYQQKSRSGASKGHVAMSAAQLADDNMMFVALNALSDQASGNSRMHQFLGYITQQVLFFSAVCRSRNATCTAMVHQLLPIEVLLPIILNDDVPDGLRAACIRLFTTSAVDVEGSVDLTDKIRSLRHVTQEENSAYNLEEDVSSILETVKSFVYGYFDKTSGVMSLKKSFDHHMVLDAVVELCGALVVRGVYAMDEYMSIATKLAEVLDGRNDATGPQRFEASEEIKPIIETKLSVVGIINTIFDFLLTRHVGAVVHFFERGTNTGHFSQILDIDPYSDISAHSRTRMERENEDSIMGRLGGTERKVFREISYIVSVIMDVAKYQDKDLSIAAIQLFCKITNMPGELHVAVQRVQLLTSKASEDYYNNAKGYASVLELCSRSVLTLERLREATEAISEIEVLLTSRSGGYMIEKIAMMRHLEVPQIILDLLGGIHAPPRPEYREFVLQCVSMLKLLAQDELVVDIICRQIASVLHLATYDVDILALFRTIYVGKDTVHSISFDVIREIVNCIAQPQSSVPAVTLLQDILSKKDVSGKYINRNQNMVWKALVMDTPAQECIQFRRNWTGKKGSKIRDKLLQSSEYFMTNGELRLHLELVRLLFLCAKMNESVKPEEVRHEVFGPNSVDDLMEVVTNRRLLPFYRHNYINLLQVLVVDDPSCVSTFFGHRLFPKFVEVSKKDLASLHVRCAAHVGKEASPEVINALFSPTENTNGDTNIAFTPKLHSEHEDHLPPLSMEPQTEMERIVEDNRSGVQFMVEHVCLGVLPCLRHAAEKFSIGGSRVSMAFQNTMTVLLNEAVDLTCELTRFIFIQNDFMLFPGICDQRMCRKKLRDFLLSANAGEFRGTELWADDVGNLAEAIRVNLKQDTSDENPLVARETEAAHHKPLTTSWMEFIKRNLTQSPQLHHDNIFASGAGILLRAGEDGTAFVQRLVQNLDELHHDKDTINVLHLLRQVANLADRHPMDDSTLLQHEPCGDSMHILSFSKSLSERQDLIASWAGSSGDADILLLPKVVDCLNNQNNDIVHAAATCAITLLEGGNLNMQGSFMNWVRLHTDEDVFIVLRNRFSSCRDALRMYRHAKLRGTSPSAFLEDVPMCQLLLRFVQLLCEGHNNEVQNYFRIQPDNQVSVNILESLAELLECCGTIVDGETVHMTNQLLATITETIQGPCRDNQEMYVSINAAEFIVQLLGVTPGECDGTQPEDMKELQNNAITGLLSLIEGRVDMAYVSSLLQSLHLETLGEAMDRSMDEYNEAKGGANVITAGLSDAKHMLLGDDGESELTDELCIGVNIFIFFKYALDLQNLSHNNFHGEFADKKGTTLKQALRETRSYKKINTLVAMIEIVRNGTLERAYFRIPQISKNNLRETSKEHLIKVVKRDSDNQRLQDFFERSQKLIFEMTYYQDLRKTPGLAFIHENTHYFEILSLLAAFAVNIMLLTTLRSPNDLYEDPQTPEERLGFTILGFILVIVQSLLFVNFFFGPTRVFLNDHWMRWQDEENEKRVQESRKNLSIEPPVIDREMIDKVSPPQYFFHSIFMLMRFGQFWQHVLFVVAAYMGFFTSPIWYSLLLLQITQKSAQLYNVVLAVTKNGTSLILTGILLLIVIYIFAIVAFFNFSEFISPYHDFGNGFNCDTLLQCMLVLTDTGLRFGGGIGEVMVPPSFATNVGYGRLVFDFLFFVILIVIFLNIVFGIIVDTFAELRERREAIEEDQAQKCFICGIESNSFDRVSPGGFEHHVKFEHNMWHYLYFFHYIKMKPQDELNGQEHYVAANIEQKEAVFFPIGKAMMLSAELTPEEEAQEQEARITRAISENVALQLSQLEGKLTSLNDRMERLELMSQQAAGTPLLPDETQMMAASMSAHSKMPYPKL